MTLLERYEKYLAQYKEALPRVKARDPKWAPEMSRDERTALIIEVEDTMNLLTDAIARLKKTD